jgi:hypothetical protein
MKQVEILYTSFREVQATISRHNFHYPYDQSRQRLAGTTYITRATSAGHELAGTLHNPSDQCRPRSSSTTYIARTTCSGHDQPAKLTLPVDHFQLACPYLFCCFPKMINVVWFFVNNKQWTSSSKIFGVVSLTNAWFLLHTPRSLPG